MQSTLKLSTVSYGANGHAASDYKVTAEFRYEQRDGAVLDSVLRLYENGQSSATVSACMPLRAGVYVGAQAQIQDNQVNNVDMASSSGGWTFTAKNLVSNKNTLFGCSYLFPLCSNATVAIDVASDESARVGIVHTISPQVRASAQLCGLTRACTQTSMRYKAARDGRVGIAARTALSPNFDVASGLDVSVRDSKDFSFGISLSWK